jgi:hypothetical protein
MPSDRVALEVTGSRWEVARILEPHGAGTHLTVLTHRRHPEVTVKRPDRSPDRSSFSTPSLTSTHTFRARRENQRDIDTDRYVLAAQSRQVAGAAERKARARAIAQTGLPACVLPNKPLSRIVRRYGPTQTEPQRSSFMPREAGAGSVDCSGHRGRGGAAARSVQLTPLARSSDDDDRSPTGRRWLPAEP